MSQDAASIEITDRDLELLRVLARGPFTTRQLLRLTRFPNLDKLWRRLRILQAASLVASWTYAPMVDRSSYFKLTRQAYRLLFLDEPLPNDAYFNEIKLGSQQHTFAIVEFVSLIEQSASNVGWHLVDYRRDRDFEIVIDGHVIRPDGYVRLHKEGQVLDILLEIDCGTEPIRSQKNRESLQKKILAYDTLAQQSNVWFRVFHVFTTSSIRIAHFLDLVGELIEQPKTRTPFLATMLDDVASAVNPALDPIFFDHRREQHSVVLASPGGVRRVVQNDLLVGAAIW